METESGNVRVTILGTGTSTGIPIIGCSCRVCTSSDPRDNRLRCSCYVQAEGVGLLIDAGPDFRIQALREEIPGIDGVLITHHHFDHVVGLDDLRPYLFENRSPIPCFAPDETEQVLRRMFGYIFDGPSYPGVPNLTLESVDHPFLVKSRRDPERTITVTPIPARHGDLQIMGYRIGRFAYLTDISGLPASSFELLEGLDVLVLDALRHEPHQKHLTIGQAVQMAERIGADNTWFIHMTHSILHAEEDEKLPDTVSFAYDGLRITAGY